jgi:DNA polymerase elongation subunit (family B)
LVGIGAANASAMRLADRYAEQLAAAQTPQRILVFDIETAPAQAFVWGLFDQNISPSQVIQPSRVLCFAAKWLGESRTMFFSERKSADDMIAAAWSLLDEADIVVGYNHVKFDVPHLQREMVLRGYGPPSPWVDIDLLPVMRKRFKFMSNKLGAIVDALGLDAKDDPGGFDTWKRVLAGDVAAWKTMEQYNRQDVQITADLFVYLRAWLKMPHAGLWSGEMNACADCGGTRLSPDGIHRTKTAAYLRVVCEECHAHMRLMSNGQTRAI